MKGGTTYVIRSNQAEIYDGFYKSDIINGPLKTTHAIHNLGNTSFDMRYLL